MATSVILFLYPEQVGAKSMGKLLRMRDDVWGFRRVDGTEEYSVRTR
jgi:hypothetical protein